MLNHSNNLNGSKAANRPARRSADGVWATLSASLPPWQIERAKILHRICTGIAGRVESGQPLRKAVTWFVWYWRARYYRSEPHRRLRLSRKTLLRLYYQWRHAGRTPQAFALHYKAHPSLMTGARLNDFIAACLTPGIRSYAAAHAHCGNLGLSVSRFQKALPAGLRHGLTALFYLNRATESRRARLRRSLREFKGVLKASARNVKPANRNPQPFTP